MYEINLSVAGNYEDKLYIGGALNFDILSYKKKHHIKK